MTDAELFAFNTVFQSLRRVFNLRGEEHEIRDVSASYFKAFRRWNLKDLEAGAEIWIRTGKRFPKPAEWLDSIPKRTRVVELPAMTDAESAAYLRAELKGFEDDPCGCLECQAAGVTHRYLRFVPDVTADEQDRKVKDLPRDRIVTAGHWAHGAELQRWYLGRDQFYALKSPLGGVNPKTGEPKVSFEKRLEQIFAQRTRAVSDLEPVA